MMRFHNQVRLNRTELQRILNMIVIENLSKDTIKEKHASFLKIDTDHSGRADLEEFKNAF